MVKMPAPLEDGRISRGRKVSVILPTYNRADTIGRAIQSVLEQTHSDLELIVVDDYSDDETSSVISSFEDDRLKLVRLSVRHGVSGARNVGLKECSSRLIAFQDSDDVWMPHKLERQLATLDLLSGAGVRIAAIGCRHAQLDEGYRSTSPQTPPKGRDPVVSVVDRFGVLAGCLGGDGTPKLLLDLDVGESETQFDEEMPAIVDRDFLFRFVTAQSMFAVLEEDLIAVARGRSDHVANAERAAAAYQRYVQKYSEDLAKRLSTRDWYIYLAARQMSASRSLSEARKLVRLLSRRRRWLQIELLFGAALGQKGLALAARFGVRPDWGDRCANCAPRTWSANDGSVRDGE